MKTLFSILLLACCLTRSFADEKPAQEAAKLDGQIPVKLAYLLALPADYEKGEKWPLLLFLHGAGERGDNLELVKVHGPPKQIEQGKKFPCIVVSPQCPPDQWWEPLELVALIDDLCAKYKVDRDRIYCTGLSMGGFGTWSLAARIPDRLAAIAPICGGGEAYWARRYGQLPIWAFHGAKDGAVPLERSEEMVEAVKQAGGNVKLTVYPELEHDSWTRTYDDPAFYEWLPAQKRTSQD